jgi:hypothetical protein
MLIYYFFLTLHDNLPNLSTRRACAMPNMDRENKILTHGNNNGKCLDLVLHNNG